MKHLLTTTFVLFIALVAHAQNPIPQIDTVIIGDGFRYEGQWPEGEGVRYSAEGLIKGHFVKGVAEGMCLSSSADCQQIYYGEFKNGKRDGYGRLARPAGFFYEGVFKDGYPEGVGTMFFSAAFVFKGTFHLGKPVDGSYYHMKSKSDMKEHIPDFPEVELTKGQKKILKNLQKQKTKSVETADKSLLESPKFFGESLFCPEYEGDIYELVKSRCAYCLYLPCVARHFICFGADSPRQGEG